MEISDNILQIVAYAYSAIGIALAVFSPAIFKVHARSLDYLQWAYLFSISLTGTSIPFSKLLTVSFSQVGLPQTTLDGFFCPLSTFVCSMAFALSFLVFFVGFLILMRLVTIPEKVREKGLTFPKIYRMTKGFFKWFYLPLAYTSLFHLMAGTTDSLIPSAVILAVCVIFPIVQVVIYRRFDAPEEDPWIKWLEFWNYCKALLFALLIVLEVKFASFAPPFYIPILIITYAAVFGYLYNFGYPVFGRVLFFLGEAVMYFLVSIYISSSDWFSSTYLDLFLLGAILLLDIIGFITEAIQAWKNRKVDGQIIPEETNDGIKPKKNRYEVEDVSLPKNDSKDNLNDSRASSNAILGNSSKIDKSKGQAARARRK